MDKIRYVFSDLVELTKLFSTESSKKNVGSFYRVIISDSFDSDNKVAFSTEETKKVEKRTWYGRKQIVEEKIKSSLTIGVYAEKKEDGIYEMITGKKLEIIPIPGNKFNDSIFYCYKIEEIKSADELLKMKKELEDISNIDRKIIEDKLLEISNRVWKFSILAPMGENSETVENVIRELKGLYKSNIVEGIQIQPEKNNSNKVDGLTTNNGIIKRYIYKK